MLTHTPVGACTCTHTHTHKICIEINKCLQQIVLTVMFFFPFRWLFACARSGRKADEGKFSIDNTHSTSLSAQTSHPQQTTPAAHSGSPAASENPESGKGTKGSTTSDSSIPAAETFQPNPQSKPQQTQSKDAGSLPKPSEVTHGQSEDDQLLKQKNATELASSTESVRSITVTSVEKVPSSSASDQEARDARLCDLADPMGSAKAMAQQQQQQQSQGVQSQKENLKTPVGRKGSWAAAPMAGRKATHNRVEVRRALTLFFYMCVITF